MNKTPVHLAGREPFFSATLLCSFLLFALCAPSPPSAAHDLWIEPAEDGYVLLSGHKHSTHGGAESVPYDPAIVRGARCFDERGLAVEAAVTTIYPVHVRGACAAVVVSLSSGYWTKTPYGTKNVPRNEAQQPISSWLSLESVKRLNAWSETLAVPLSEELELVPLENPLGLKPGDKLRLLVCEGKKPVAGVAVAYDGETRGETAADGLINLRIRHGGLQIIQATRRTPLQSEKADETVATATLNFEVGGEH
jgi:nickel transport protein